MAVRTVSPLARSIGASAQIGRSERDRLQAAVRQLEKDLSIYAKKQKSRTKKKGRWKILRKIGQGLTTVGALTGNPVLAGIGLAVTSGGGFAEGSVSKAQVGGAKGIKTGAADPLSDLLFVGRTAREVKAGAEEYKGSQVGAFEARYEQDIFDIGVSVLTSMAGAGQAGTFGGTAYTAAIPGVEASEGVAAVAAQEAGGTGIQGFLTKPVVPYGQAPGADATAMERYLYQSRKMTTPSYGSLLGGVSPYEQQIFGEPLSRLGKGLDYGFKPTSKEAGTSFLKRFQTGWGAYDPTMLGSKKNPIPFWSAYNAPARRA
jgi:hypothetical protein